MTSFNRHDQNRSYCPESYSLKEALCTTDLDCQKDAYIPNKNGRWTGRCLLNSRISIVNQTDNVTLSDVGLCEMEGKPFNASRTLLFLIDTNNRST